MLLTLAYQFFAEFKAEIRTLLETSQRDPCFTEWTGERALNCKDPACRRELLHYLAPFGDLTTGRGLRSYCEEMEARYWILRAWRFTHPVVLDAKERMKGVGFPGVPADQVGKLRARGPGWDGYGNTKNELCS